MNKQNIYALALKEAEKSPCIKRKVGAVIVDINGAVIARGHNFIPSFIPNFESCEDSNNLTKPEVIHAEIAAINNLKSSGYKMFVTHEPCSNCMEAIKKAKLEVEVIPSFMKFDKDKLKYNLIPTEVTKELAKVLTYGAKKYKPNNWKLVDDKTRYIDALYRHIEAWRAGEKFDNESNLLHLSHALANISFLLYFEINNSLSENSI